MGAYFIRRSSNNELYRKVLARYVAMATREGVPQAFFPEGGLSTDGKLREPKFGLLSYMLSGYSQTNGRDVVFVPVGINYDRVMEDRILTKKLEKDHTGRDYSVSIRKSLSHTGALIWRRLQGKLYKNGHACVSFGNPISLNEWMKKNKISLDKSTVKQKTKIIEKLGDNLMTQVGNVIPIMPVALVASVFSNAKSKPLSELDLKSRIFKLVSDYEKRGFHVHIPREDQDYAVGTGLRMLTLRHIIIEDENGLFRANPEETVILNYYSNSIAHL
jgi:glycerol-3-phosphate O-acyltransferase